MLHSSVYRFAHHLRYAGLIGDAEEKLEGAEEHGGRGEGILEQILGPVLQDEDAGGSAAD